MDEHGLECYYNYYNQLFFIERRFFHDPSHNCNDNGSHHHDYEDDDDNDDDGHRHEVVFDWFVTSVTSFLSIIQEVSLLSIN